MTSQRTPDACLVEFVRSAGVAGPAETLVFTPLEGGVSSDIWRVDLAQRSICIKRALPRLKVAQAWTAPIERNRYEWAWMEFAAAYCPGCVPEPIASDPVHGIFAMAYLDPGRYPVWKRRLLDGVAEPGVAAGVATTIARIHSASAGDPDVAQRFATDPIFHAIRLEPYLLATALRHPRLAAALHALARRTAQTRRALVHGDVSPKNILLGPRGPILLDAECAWYGDPAFDAAFCLNHFLLKCIARPASRDDYLACFEAFAHAYFTGLTWEPRAAIELRIASLLPALLLARIDGKSPVEYIRHERDRQRVRDAACPLIERAPQRLADVVTAWHRMIAAP
jgi:aminoglycoside phosphotransferase (APT) family kinase protein